MGTIVTDTRRIVTIVLTSPWAPLDCGAAESRTASFVPSTPSVQPVVQSWAAAFAARMRAAAPSAPASSVACEAVKEGS